MVLYGRFVYRNTRREEPKTEDKDETDACSEIDVEAPNHGDGYEGEQEVGCNVDGGIEDADVLKGDGVEASCCTTCTR